jgi:hypothetical protein
MNSFIGKIVGILQTIKGRINRDPFEKSVYTFVQSLNKKAERLESSGQAVLASRARLASQLIKKGHESTYISETDKMYERNYGKTNVIESEDDGNISVILWWDSAFDEEHNHQINESYNEDMIAAMHKCTKAQDLGWKIVQANFRKWMAH